MAFHNPSQLSRQVEQELNKSAEKLLKVFIKPSTMLYAFSTMFTEIEKEQVKQTTEIKGDLTGVKLFFEILNGKTPNQWREPLLDILKNSDLNLKHVVQLVEDDKKYIKEVYSNGGGIREKRSLETDSLRTPSSAYIDLNKEMKNRVSAVFHKLETKNIIHLIKAYNDNILTDVDIDNVKADDKNKGRTQGAQLLLERLVLYENWFPVLLDVLRHPDVMCGDQADFLEKTTADIRNKFLEEMETMNNFTGNCPGVLWYRGMDEKLPTSLEKPLEDIFKEFIKPSCMLHAFNGVLSREEKVRIEAETKNHGDIDGAELLFKTLCTQRDWINTLQNILKLQSLQLQHVADLIKKDVIFFDQSVSNGNRIEGLLPSSVFIQHNLKMKASVSKIFHKLDPQNILHVVKHYNSKVLTQKDIENVKAEINNKGAMAGAELLLERLVLYHEWFPALVKALRDPDVMCDEFANELERDTATLREQYEIEVQRFSAAGIDDNFGCNNNNSSVLSHGRGSVEADSGHFKKSASVISNEYETDGIDESDSPTSLKNPFQGSSPHAASCVDVYEEGGKTKLMIAAEKGNLEDMKLCIKDSCMINKRDQEKGKTALIFAVQKKNEACIKLLVNSGCDPNLQDKHGNTALMYAVASNLVEITIFLIQKGADVDVANEKGSTALMTAAQKGHKRCLETLLCQRASCNKVHAGNGYTALMYAALHGHTACVELMMTANCAINKRNENGQTALLLAAWAGQDSCIRVLLKNKCNVNLPDNTGQTALMFACEKGHSKCVQLLIENQASVNQEDNDKNTAIFFALRSDNHECIRLLLQAGANVTLVNKFRDTPMQVAKSRCAECYSLLTGTLRGQRDRH